MTSELYRQLPGVDRWLETAIGQTLAAEYSRAEVVDVMRIHLARLRGAIRAGATALPELEGDAYGAALRADLLARRSASLKPMINATGIVLHTNLGRAPLADEAVAAVAAVAAGYSNLEFDRETGTRGSRSAHVEPLLTELTGAEAALVVNNCASAVLLALRGLAGDGEVVVSRGELIEIGGSFRMPDVIAASGARMVEVGTTNRTSLADYAAAIGERTRVLLTSHPSNYRVVGFTRRPGQDELVALAREHGLVLVHDLGSGALVDVSAAGLAPEPTVQDCLATGADLVAFSGDKLLGGPQAGILVGRAERIERLRRDPYARAARIDKLSLGALEATLRLYRPPNDPWERVPALRMICASADEIGRRAESLVAAVVGATGSNPQLTAEIVDDVSFAGGGSLPMSELPTRVVALRHAGIDAAGIARALRTMDRPVVARVAHERVLLDLRTVLPAEEGDLAAAIGRIGS